MEKLCLACLWVGLQHREQLNGQHPWISVEARHVTALWTLFRVSARLIKEHSHCSGRWIQEHVKQFYLFVWIFNCAWIGSMSRNDSAEALFGEYESFSLLSFPPLIRVTSLFLHDTLCTLWLFSSYIAGLTQTAQPLLPSLKEIPMPFSAMLWGYLQIKVRGECHRLLAQQP